MRMFYFYDGKLLSSMCVSSSPSAAAAAATISNPMITQQQQSKNTHLTDNSFFITMKTVLFITLNYAYILTTTA